MKFRIDRAKVHAVRFFVVHISLLAFLLHGMLGVSASDNFIVCVAAQTIASPQTSDRCCVGDRALPGSDESHDEPNSNVTPPSCHCCKVAQSSSADLPKPVPAAQFAPAGFAAIWSDPLLSGAIALPAVPPPRA